jgi:hypothetical protein
VLWDLEVTKVQPERMVSQVKKDPKGKRAIKDTLDQKGQLEIL